ncbi:hypothetical protein CIK06_12185 [Plantactinospora sp. KBS50]|nr:hypothetical protein CIK06_12185 [Plantactinospora sp. KBS50]
MHLGLANEFEPTLRRLLDHDGPYRDPESGAWFVARYDQVRAALADRRLLTRSSAHATAHLDADQRAAVEPLEAHLRRWFVFSDEPAQHRLRLAFRRALAGSGRDRELADGLAAAARRATATRAAGGDLFATFVVPFTGAAVTAMLGTPDGDAARLTGWGERLLAYLGMDGFDPAVVDAAVGGLTALRDYYVEDYLHRGRGVVAETFRVAAADGAAREDLVAAFTQLLTGALEPSRTALAEGIARVGDPAVAEAYRARRTAFVSEVLRLATPFHFAPRRTAGPVEVGGRCIPAGTRVRLVLPAANRDPAVFPRPGLLDVTRPERRHLAFGWGRHVCVGTRVAEGIVAAGLDAVTASWPAGLTVRLGRTRTAGMTVATALTACPPPSAPPERDRR